MSQKSARKPKRVVGLTVLRTERVTPHMVRLVLGGPGIADFHDNDDSDHYVKLLFPPKGVSYPEPFDLAAIEADFPRHQQPVKRTYTVREFHPERGELVIDFVYHGDEGVAGPWAAVARPGDRLHLLGPGGAYSPSPEADWHLLIGDEAAIPAISSALARIPAGAPTRVVLQVANPDERQTFASDADVTCTWLYRSDAAGPDPRQDLVDFVTALEFPAGQGHLFVHGEAETVMKKLRPHLLHDRGIHRDWLSISGYWRQGNTEETFRAWKAEHKKALLG